MSITKIDKMLKILEDTAKIIIDKNEQIVAFWWTGVENNWGDALNPILIQNLCGKKPILSNKIINTMNLNIYSVIGSVLGIVKEKNLVIWGSGFISSTSRFKDKPRKICAVRGPLTREIIIKQGIDCPEIFGDPALLYPLFYRPIVKKSYKLGILPHYVDQNSQLLNIFKENPDILIINVLAGVNRVVDDICKCERVASSSLHGIIAADAYGIPSIWIRLSDNVDGNGFKYYDYFKSVGRVNEKPLRITESTTIQDIYNQYRKYRLNIDLEKLLEVCPFLENTEIEVLKERCREVYSKNINFEEITCRTENQR